MPHPLSIALLLVACGLIAVGRLYVRGSWRMDRGGGARKTIGWLLVIFGGMVMIAAIIGW